MARFGLVLIDLSLLFGTLWLLSWAFGINKKRLTKFIKKFNV